MPSSLSHAMVAVAGGSIIAPRPLLRTFLTTGAVCAVLGAVYDGVQYLSPFSSRQFTLSRHLMHGPFSELFYLLLPLMAITRLVWYRRGMPWPRRRRERLRSLWS